MFPVTDAQVVLGTRTIRLCSRQLDQLEAELLPAILDCRQSSPDAGATHHVRFIKQLYTDHLSLLIQTLDECVPTKLYLHITGKIPSLTAVLTYTYLAYSSPHVHLPCLQLSSRTLSLLTAWELD